MPQLSRECATYAHFLTCQNTSHTSKNIVRRANVFVKLQHGSHDRHPNYVCTVVEKGTQDDKGSNMMHACN